MRIFKRINLYIVAFAAICSFTLTSCHHDEDTTTSNNNSSITALANLNPNEPVIANVSNKEGQSVVIMGTKDAQGYAKKLEQVIITQTEEENPTEIFFDENEKIKEMIAPNGVRFQFDWISDKEIALTLIDPNTNEQLNTLLDLSNKNNQSKVVSRGSNVKTRVGNSSLKIEPIVDVAPIISTKKHTRAEKSGIVGNVYLEQCGAPTTAQCWVDVYDYSNLTGSFGRGKYRGRFTCTKVGDGHYQFQLPANYNVHHNMADYCDDINDIIGNICDANAFTAPGSGAKEAMCIYISGALASGIVSAPVAAGFLVACETTSVALDLSCSLLDGSIGGIDLAPGAPSIGDGLCAALREMDYTWDTPLLLQPVVNALPSCIYGTAQVYKADGNLKDMKVTWGGKPVINSFKLVPSAPSHGVSYQAIAELYCLPIGTNVTMDIIGTDGYSNSQTSTITSGQNLNYKATLDVPGADTGVKDVCTVTAVTPDGETVTKKASLVFQ